MADDDGFVTAYATPSGPWRPPTDAEQVEYLTAQREGRPARLPLDGTGSFGVVREIRGDMFTIEGIGLGAHCDGGLALVFRGPDGLRKGRAIVKDVWFSGRGVRCTERLHEEVPTLAVGDSVEIRTDLERGDGEEAGTCIRLGEGWRVRTEQEQGLGLGYCNIEIDDHVCDEFPMLVRDVVGGLDGRCRRHVASAFADGWQNALKVSK